MFRNISDYLNFGKMLFLGLLMMVLLGVRAELEAAGADDDLLAPGFGEGFGPNGDGTIPLDFPNFTFLDATVTQADGKIIVAGGELFHSAGLMRFHPDGQLDTTFGTNGFISLVGFDRFMDVLVQPDGKIVAVTSDDEIDANHGHRDMLVRRYMPDGRPDGTFGEDGVARIDFDGGRDEPYSVLLQPDGKIVVGGSATDCGIFSCNNTNYGLARLNSDGHLDTSFSGDGKLSVDMNGDGSEKIHKVMLDVDGHIVASGFTCSDVQCYVGLIRVTPDGRLDDRFGGNGKVRTVYHNLRRTSHVIQLDGKIVFPVETPLGGAERIDLVRLQPNGELDTTFGDNGTVMAPPGLTAEVAFSTGKLIGLPNRQMILAAPNGANGAIVVAKFNSEGELATSFGDGLGYVTLDKREGIERVQHIFVGDEGFIDILHTADNGQLDYLTRLHPNGQPVSGEGAAYVNPTDSLDGLRDILVQPDGKIVVVGNRRVAVDGELTANFAVARLTAGGTLDESFGENGFVAETDYLGRAQAVVLDAEQNILTAGTVRLASSGSDYDFTLRRYTPDGRPLPFPAAGADLWPITDISGDRDTVFAMAVQPDGRVIVGGRATVNDSPDIILVRYLPDGSLDPAFNGGMVVTDFDGRQEIDTVQAIAIQADGKILVLGKTREEPTSEATSFLVRYLPDGTLDTTFGKGDGQQTVRPSNELALQANGNIVVGGQKDVDGKGVFSATRYLPDGTLDSSFNGGGHLSVRLEKSAFVTDMLLEEDGAVVLGGCMQDELDQFALVRLRPDGQPDPLLSEDGRATFTVNTVRNACVHALARDVNTGHYILAGDTELELGDTQLALLRVVAPNSHNVSPVAADDQYTVTAGSELFIPAPGLFANDSDPDGDILTIGDVFDTAFGEVTVFPNGSFIYQPPEGFSGTDQFGYRLTDGQSNSNTVTVLIEVLADEEQNVPPTAVVDSYTVAQDGLLTVNAPGVLDNDSDADGDRLTAVLGTISTNGTVSLNENGSFTYDPDDQFTGTDRFTYHAHDGEDNSAAVMVTIDVVPAGTNVRPTAVGDSYTVSQGNTLTETAPGVLANDSDGDGDGLTAVLDRSTINGSLTLNADGSFTYNPNAGFNGSDRFTYRAHDGLEHSSTVTVMIEVLGDEPLPPPPPPAEQQIFLPLVIK